MEKKNRKMRTGEAARKNKKLVILSAVVAVLASAFVIGIVVYVIFGMNSESLTETEEDAIFEVSIEESEEAFVKETMPPDVVNAIVSGGKSVSDALNNRPVTVEMTDENRSTFVSIDSCQIVNTSKVQIDLSSEGIPKSDDKYYYLFEEAVYQNSIPEGAEPVAKKYKDSETSFTLDLNKGKASSRLFSKFTVAVKLDGEYVSISHPKFITNPEACAGYNYGGMQHHSIKGILADPLRIGELADLNISYCTYNIPLSHILTTSGGIEYSYDGVTYHFKTSAIETYDQLFKRLNGMGIDVAAIVLNDASTSAYPDITHPDARGKASCPYRMFNGATDGGVKACAAIGSFLAGRYSGAGHGNVSMWIIANEVNARKEYNYMPYVDVNTYTEAFVQCFRVFYNAIKSQNASAKVYYSLDQRWTLNSEKTGDYDAKDFLDIFTKSISDYGNIDWGLAAHPYSYPNGATAFWKANKYTNHTVSTPVISMDNLEVLTNYMQRPEMRDTSGNVRSIILSEIGYSSTSGETLQAAAFAYAYTIMEKNGYIDALMLSRQTDAADEIAALGLALGLQSTGGKHKYIYNVFKYIDTDKRQDVISFAYDIVGKTF
ncbi:DUF5722 domain-containing protein [Butyrivibrio sp. YAB3001]|uniref:DUF5722 domain-containing protein n=1 Tax=Butyrivibrio sp. YAB3001 TaxID=1520812 RepID=UPI0008F68091|nr:DUF5722 domain-containing protein [Butyrivibrio sp. YAB3001]SFB88440.1 hypothetical protein SAMN02910398_01002 [Butyrivibrio sp. YAB3001]